MVSGGHGGCCGVRGRLAFRNLRHAFGDRFLLYLWMIYFGLKGVVFTLLQTSMLPYFQRMGVSGTMYQLASVVAMIPWSMKGWIGVLSDIVPLGRFHKRGYLLLSAGLGLAGMLGLASLPLRSLVPGDVWPVASLFCLGSAFIATFDLLCEGKYSELMREEHAGPEVLTLVWASLQLGSLVAALVVGALVDRAGPRPMVLACLPLVLLALWRTAMGDLPEKPARSWSSLRLRATSEPGLFVLATAMAAASLLVALATVVFTAEGRALWALCVSCGLVLCSFRALPRVLALSNLYMFMVSVAYIDLSGPLAYFYTGGAGCVAGGPAFSYSYYLAVSNVVGSAGSMFGAVAFQWIQRWSFRSAFCVTTCIQVLASIFDLLIIGRLNLAVGVSDKAAYLFGDAACQNVAAQMAMMPQALLTSRLCPRGAEATVFAILAGFQNFGSAVGSILGAQLSQSFGIRSSRQGPCDFRWLPFLLVLCHVVVPVCCLPFTWWLVPNARMDDEAAFEAVSPPPTFRSPPASPSSSPRMGPASTPSDPGEYFLMHEGEPGRQVSG